MTNYRAGDKIVVELDNYRAERLNITWVIVIYKDDILEHIPTPKPEPIVVYQCKIGEEWISYNKGHPFDLPEPRRKLTLLPDGTWTKEVVK